MYKSEDINFDDLYETVEYQDIVDRDFWSNQTILERLWYLKNIIRLYDENLNMNGSSTAYSSSLSYQCEARLDSKINKLYYDIERWLVNHVFDDDV